MLDQIRCAMRLEYLTYLTTVAWRLRPRGIIARQHQHWRADGDLDLLIVLDHPLDPSIGLEGG